MVIGRGKRDQIMREPLLAWYFDVFKEVLYQPETRLLSIGYGFGDEHINEVIANAVVSHGLRIYIISPSSPGAFRERLPETHRGTDIWNGLGGYFPYAFREMFPADQSISRGWQAVQSQYFERRIS